MAAMVNALGGTEQARRGKLYFSTFSTDVINQMTEVVRLEGPGRLLVAFSTRGDRSGYSSSRKINVRIIPDGDESRTLKKHHRDACSSTSHTAAFRLMQTLNTVDFNASTSINLGAKIPFTRVINEIGNSSAGIVMHDENNNYSFPNQAEGILDNIVDETTTLYLDGLYFDESLVIEGSWDQKANGYEGNKNGVILLYEIFE